MRRISFLFAWLDPNPVVRTAGESVLDVKHGLRWLHMAAAASLDTLELT